MRILLAEDDRVSALKLRRVLEKLGHEVEVASNGSEAWKRVGRGDIALVISDWMMPEMDGPELCRHIRGRPEAPYTYVILLTTRDSRDDRLAGLQAGADDFLVKPFDVEELVARLNVAERILSMQDQLRAHTAQLVSLHATLEWQNQLLGRQNAQLAERAATDGLTGLCNRRHFDEVFVAALSYTQRHEEPLSLLLIDVDHFKAFNDTYGHQAGDDVLRAVGQAMRNGARLHDTVARYGGEEFVILLPGIGADEARLVAERLRGAIENGRGLPQKVTASFGIATSADPANTMSDLLADADAALYHAKATGRNRVVHQHDLAADRRPIAALPAGSRESVASR